MSKNAGKEYLDDLNNTLIKAEIEKGDFNLAIDFSDVYTDVKNEIKYTLNSAATGEILISDIHEELVKLNSYNVFMLNPVKDLQGLTYEITIKADEQNPPKYVGVITNSYEFYLTPYKRNDKKKAE